MFSDLLGRLSELDAFWVLFAAAVVPFAESLPLVDTFAPGDVGMSVLGLSVTGRPELLAPSIALASAACIAGDSLSWWLGHRWGRKVVESGGRIGRHLREPVARAEKALGREGWRGGWSVFVARWIGILRGIYPFVCGMADMPYRRFISWSAPAAILWCATLVTVGFAVGEQLARFLDRAGFVAVGVAIVVGVVAWLVSRRRHRAETTARDLS